MAKRVVDGVEALKGLGGEHAGHSEWLEMTQERVNAFADATLDHQWIHTDPARAQKESPFRQTIAHGYLTLSLVPYLLDQILEVRDVSMAINYGMNKLRFPSPVPVGSRIRLGVTIRDVDEVVGGVQCQLDCVIEIEGASKPAMAAEVLFRYFA